ncbi:MAG: transglutaminase domain-containing protein [Planctomycetes bacterium]|nr:transglutaminase domain-containing protein [Planctomycetota bacterium]
MTTPGTQERRAPWWRRGLAVGVFLLTAVALAALSRVRGPAWVTAPLGLSLLGCLVYRWLAPRLSAGAAVVLVVAYFVLVAVLRPYLEPSANRFSALDGLSIVGLVILYPAQAALWTGRRTVQELMLLGLVAVCQFLYGMTLARTPSWLLGAAFCPLLVFALLQYAVAREVDAVGVRPLRPRGHALRLAGLALVLMPVLGVLGAAVFYLLPRYATLTGAFDLLGGSAAPVAEADAEPAPGDSRAGSLRTGPSRALDLTRHGRIRRDPAPVHSVRIRLEAHGRELPPEYGGRLYLRSHVLDECREQGWAASGSHYPRVHRPDARGRVDLPGPAPRPRAGYRLDVRPLHPDGRADVVSLGRPVRVAVDRALRGHPEEELVFARPLGPRARYGVEGEVIYGWEQVRELVRRHGLHARHEEQDHYTHVPERPRREKVASLARTLVARARGGTEALDALVGYLRSPPFRYTLELGPVQFGANPTEDFLCRSRAGHCERFADGLAVLCRHADLAARVVTGYLGGEWRERPIPGFVFRRQDAHVWVEVHFERLGWVAVDPAPAGDAGALGLALPFETLPLEAANAELALAQDSFSGAAQLTLYQDLLARAREIVEAVGWPVLLVVLGGLLAMVALRRRRLAAGAADGAAAPETGPVRVRHPILELLGALQRRGVRPRRGETPLEFAARVEPLVETPLVPIVERLYAVCYGGHPLSAAERAAFEAWLERVRRVGAPVAARPHPGASA